MPRGQLCRQAEATDSPHRAAISCGHKLESLVLLQADVLCAAGLPTPLGWQQSPHCSGQRVLHREHTALPDVTGYCRLLEASYLFMALPLRNSYAQAVCHTILEISVRRVRAKEPEFQSSEGVGSGGLQMKLLLRK